MMRWSGSRAQLALTVRFLFRFGLHSLGELDIDRRSKETRTSRAFLECPSPLPSTTITTTAAITAFPSQYLRGALGKLGLSKLLLNGSALLGADKLGKHARACQAERRRRHETRPLQGQIAEGSGVAAAQALE